MNNLGYLQFTIDSYDSGVESFISSTKGNDLPEEVARFIGLLPKEATVLDVGCASGIDTGSFCINGNQVVGIDLSRGLLEEARKRVPYATFLEMDMRSLVFPDECVDAVWARASLLHLTLDDMAIALSQIRRVLKPGGVLFIHMKKGSGSEEVADAKSMVKGSRYFTYVDEDLLRRLLGLAGFRIADLYSYNTGLRFGPERRDLWWVDAFAAKA
jgi:ubiquinone/menaquinone biosynthesis C-methylase UbiE